MQIYKFKIDLRIWHPNLAPELISKKLHLMPDTYWKSGDTRKTPTGSSLKSVAPRLTGPTTHSHMDGAAQKKHQLKKQLMN